MYLLAGYFNNPFIIHDEYNADPLDDFLDTLNPSNAFSCCKLVTELSLSFELESNSVKYGDLKILDFYVVLCASVFKAS